MSISRMCLLCVMLFAAQPVLAASALGEMAGILVNLEHYPSAAEKAKLKDIVASKESSEQEKTIANALINLKHTANDADKAKLKQVQGDASLPTDVRNLAGIILNLNHTPSAADKEKLHQMMK